MIFKVFCSLFLGVYISSFSLRHFWSCIMETQPLYWASENHAKTPDYSLRDTECQVDGAVVLRTISSVSFSAGILSFKGPF